MRKTREILRFKWHQGRRHRQVATVLAIGIGTPSEVVGRATRVGIWARVERSPASLTRGAPCTPTTRIVPLPDLQLRRTHVTMRLLHEEYLQQHPMGTPVPRALPHGRRSSGSSCVSRA
jgi:hypothetical protein